MSTKKITKKVYKTDTGYIRGYYAKNKNKIFIDMAQYPGMTRQQAFISQIKHQMKQYERETGKKAPASKIITSFQRSSNRMARIEKAWNKKESFYETHLEEPGQASKKDLFIIEINAYLNTINPATGKKYTLKQAIAKFENSEIVTTPGERRTKNFFEQFKKDNPEKFKEFRKEFGWNKKIDMEKMELVAYEQRTKIFKYKNKYVIIKYSDDSVTAEDITFEDVGLKDKDASAPREIARILFDLESQKLQNKVQKQMKKANKNGGK